MLTWLGYGCTDSWKTLLSMSVRVFLEETHIWSGGLSKEDHPHHCGWASSNPLRTWIKQKGGERADLLSAWAGTPSFSSDIGTPGSPSFRLKSRLTKLVPDHGTSQSLELYTYMWNLGKRKGRWGEEEGDGAQKSWRGLHTWEGSHVLVWAPRRARAECPCRVLRDPWGTPKPHTRNWK